MGKDEISKQFKVSPSYVRTLSRKFVANSKIRAQANRCHLNKKRILKAEHLEFLREAICQINSSPQKVSSLKHKLLSNFEGLKDISDSTVRRSLKAQLNMSYRKITVMNPKALISEKIDKMIRSGALLKILSDYWIELIFIDEFSVSSKGHKAYGWAERGKKAITSLYWGGESFSVITALSSKSFYSSMIK